MKNEEPSTTYKVRRYFKPSSLPASRTSASGGRARRKPVAQPTTYQDLLAHQDRLTQQGAVKPQTAANRASALRSFLNHCQLQTDEPVGVEFRSAFMQRLQSFADHLASEGRTARNVGNTLSALRTWRGVLLSMDTDRAAAGDHLPPFSQALRDLLKDLPTDRLSKLLSIPRYMLYGWLKGKRPRITALNHIYKIERYFGVDADELASLAGFKKGGRLAPTTVGPAPAVPYRDALAARTSEHYLAKPQADSPLRCQWLDFVRYKTEDDPMLLRTKRGAWRMAPFEFEVEKKSTWAEFLDGVEVPSARMAWTNVASYLGWLALPTDKGGAGIPAQETETLAWIAVKDKVDAYIRWMVRRNGNKYNGSVFEFISKAKSMLRGEFGYLSQQAEFQSTLPEGYRPRLWADMCAETFSLLTAKQTRNEGARTKTRDPRAPMAHILELDNPLEMIADMIQRQRADRPIGGAPIREAMWARDIALIKMLVSNPLRKRNMATLTWRPDNTGELYQHADGSWWIRVESAKFKNTRGAAGDQQYDMPVQQMVWGDLERYLKTYRPRLMKCDVDFVFLAGRHGSVPRDPHLPWAGITTRVKDLTRKYLWRCAGIGTHAFRHLVATSIIKASKLTDFKTAALVLNDRLSTVEKNYAHLKSADGANRMGELLGNTLQRM